MEAFFHAMLMEHSVLIQYNQQNSLHLFR